MFWYPLYGHYSATSGGLKSTISIIYLLYWSQNKPDCAHQEHLFTTNHSESLMKIINANYAPVSNMWQCELLESVQN